MTNDFEHSFMKMEKKFHEQKSRIDKLESIMIQSSEEYEVKVRSLNN